MGYATLAVCSGVRVNCCTLSATPLHPADPKPAVAPVAKDDEARLVSAAKRGDIAAFEELVNRYERKIYRLAKNITQNREDAEDVTQDAFVRAYRALAQYDPTRPFGAWMYAITARLCIDFHRRRRVKTVSLTRTEEGTAGEDREWELPDPSEGPEALVERSDEAAQLEALIDRLPPDYRLAILLRHAHDLSYEEIAEATDAPLGTVKARIHRARNLLRDWIEGKSEPGLEPAEGGVAGNVQSEKSGPPVHPKRPNIRKEER